MQTSHREPVTGAVDRVRTHLHALDLDWGRVLERLCFLYPPVVGVGAISVAGDLDPGVPGLQWALLAVASFGYTVVTAGVVIALYADARQVRTTSLWRPNPVLYPLLALFAAPLVAVVYLAKRHQRLGTPPGWTGWWMIVALTLVTSVSGLVAIAVAIVLQVPGLLASAAGVAGTIAVGAFPIAIHQDAAYISSRHEGWEPNPGIYLGLAFASLLVPIAQPMLAAYYLVKRWRLSPPKREA